MHCTACDATMTRRPATPRRPYRYQLSGFDVLLSGIAIHQCPGCGTRCPEIPQVSQLHRLVARRLVRKPVPLSGAEIRFLRQTAGFPSKQFAALIGVSPEYLSRVEHGAHDGFGTAADRLTRLLAVDDEPARAALSRLAESALNGGAARLRPPSFRLIHGRWQATA